MLENISWVLGVLFLLDLVGHFLFSDFSYKWRIPILTRPMPELLRPVAVVGQVGETKHGKCKLVNPDKVLIRERFLLFDQGQCYVRVSVDWSSGIPVAKGGIPAMYALGWLLAGVTFVAYPGDYGPDYIFLVVPLLLFAVLAVFSWYRVSLLLKEYSELQGSLWSHT